MRWGDDGHLHVNHELLGLKFMSYEDWMVGGAKVLSKR
jgi:hypothetical protein